jgi:hypothetical protein
MDKKVKRYLDNLPSPQKEICKRVRQIIIETFPDLEESFKNGVPWYECKYYIVGLKDHVNIGFSIEGITSEELKLFEGKGKLMRHIKVYSLDDIDEKKIVKLLKMVK